MTPQIPPDPPREIPTKSPNQQSDLLALSDIAAPIEAQPGEKKRRYKKRQPRSRNLHVGVSVLKPDKFHPYYRLRFPNPDYDPDVPGSPKNTQEALRADQRNHTELAIAKRDELGLDRFGHPPKREKTGLITAPLIIPSAIEMFFRSDAKFKDPNNGTYRSYRKAMAIHFEPWAARRGLRTVDDITLKNLGPGERRLANGRAELIDGLKLTVQEATALKTKKGGQPGETEDTGMPLAPHTVNKELRSISAVLGWLIDNGHITKMTRQELETVLKTNTLEDEAPEAVPIDHVKTVLAAARAHDVVCNEVVQPNPNRTRKVRSDWVPRPPKKKVRWNEIEFLIYFIVCTGLRIAEALNITWLQFEPDTSLPGNLPGQAPGAIRLQGWQTKTGKKRTVYLCVCPTIIDLLHRFRGDAEPTDRIFAALTYGRAKSARKRLMAKSGQDAARMGRPPKRRKAKTKKRPTHPGPPSGFDAPAFEYQGLRATCATWLAALRGPSFESQQLGHSVQVAEDYYVGRVIIPDGARTLEQAMGLTPPHVLPTVRAEIKPPSKRKKDNDE